MVTNDRRNWLKREPRSSTWAGSSPSRGIRQLLLEVELLEDRNLLSPVQFVPMSPIATGLSGADVTSAVGDINGDGHLDIISTSSRTDFEKVGDTWTMPTRHTAVWYENDGAAVPSFTSHTIAVSNSDIPWVGVGDIDANGTLDVVMEIDGKIYWYGNNGDGTVWTPHLVAGAQGDLSVWIADVMGDGHNDLILPYKNTITWWENLNGDGTEWTPHVISDQVSLPPPPPPPAPPVPPPAPSSDPGFNSQSTSNSSSPGTVVYAGQGPITYGVSTSTPVSDVAPIDSSATGLSGQSVGLLAEPAVPFDARLANDHIFTAYGDISNSNLTKSIAKADTTGLAVSVIHGGINILSVGDINGDGKLDVISSGDGSIQCWENPGSADGTWTRHTVHEGGFWGDVRMAFAQDMNGDGKLDIVSSGFRDVSWWENSAGDGSTWVRHTITNDMNAESITVGDINGDGRPDLFSFAPMSSVVTWYENNGGANPSFTPHTFSFPTGPGTVSLGDLNGDGRLDAVITSVFSNSITWFMNWDGQSPLPTPNPPSGSPAPDSGRLPQGTSVSNLATFVPPLAANVDSGVSISEEMSSGVSAVNTLPANSASNSAIVPAQADVRTGNAAAGSGQLSVHAMGTFALPAGLEDATDVLSFIDIAPIRSGLFKAK